MASKLKRLQFVDDGQLVLAKVKGRWVPVEVAVAMGDTARVTNALLSIDEWHRVGQLRAAPGEVTSDGG